MLQTINVNLKERSYKIFLKKGIIKKIPSYIKDLSIGNFCLLITNQKICSLHKNTINKILKNIPHKMFIVPDSEYAKSKEWVFKIIEELIKQDTLRRKLFIICMGGGVIGDLGGFVSSIYKRGVPCIQIPTTLLAQIDASIGGKTAIDFKKIKNIVGSFYQPKAVFIDPSFLKTLSAKEIKQGISEAIKYGAIRSKSLFSFLQRNHRNIMALKTDYIQKMTYECAKIKADIVKNDEKENRGIRTILNFGHTIAHALEGALKFKKLSHGEAVALGMIHAAYVSFYLRMCSRKDVSMIENIIKLYGLPTKVSFSTKEFLDAFTHDKKFIRGKIRMVLLSKIGKVKVTEGISINLIKRALQHIETV